MGQRTAPWGSTNVGTCKTNARGNPLTWSNAQLAAGYTKLTADYFIQLHSDNNDLSDNTNALHINSWFCLAIGAEAWVQFDWSAMDAFDGLIVDVTDMDIDIHCAMIQSANTPGMEVKLYDSLGGGFPDAGYGTEIATTGVLNVNTSGKSTSSHWDFRLNLSGFSITNSELQASAVWIKALDGGGAGVPDDKPQESE